MGSGRLELLGVDAGRIVVEEVLAEIAISAPSLADMATVSDLAAEAARALPVPMRREPTPVRPPGQHHQDPQGQAHLKPRPTTDTDPTQLDLFNLAAATA